MALLKEPLAGNYGLLASFCGLDLGDYEVLDEKILLKLPGSHGSLLEMVKSDTVRNMLIAKQPLLESEAPTAAAKLLPPRRVIENKEAVGLNDQPIDLGDIGLI